MLLINRLMTRWGGVLIVFTGPHMHFLPLDHSSWLTCLFSGWFLLRWVVAFSVSSRKIYFSALIWIFSSVRARRLDNELLKGSGRSPSSSMRTVAWVCNSSTSSLSALYCSRKSQSDSPFHWDISSKLEMVLAWIFELWNEPKTASKSRRIYWWTSEEESWTTSMPLFLKHNIKVRFKT